MTTTPLPEAAAEPVAPLRAGKAPVGTGASPLVAQLLALALVCLAAVAVQHLLVLTGTVSGTSWLTTAVDGLDGLDGGTPLVLVVGVVSIVLGLLLASISVKPRPRKGIPLATTTGAHLRRRDLRRVVDAAVDGTDAVTDTTVTVSRRRIRVTATSVATPDRDAETRAAIEERLRSVGDALERRPAVSVTIRHDEI
ncbi:DUF6286 domain-containing protein [Aeromicrobium sp. Leaf350]|uniref:DUF6286 domain-containing protein n=1 Tax=Aeromicrobium sp. Leaf350 TaxID=2876565 RepID=UPI001E56E3F8|nr:DUF6286 domain-containing protein [Aeromicrobium sp. Leaf350]